MELVDLAILEISQNTLGIWREKTVYAGYLIGRCDSFLEPYPSIN